MRVIFAPLSGWLAPLWCYYYGLFRGNWPPLFSLCTKIVSDRHQPIFLACHQRNRLPLQDRPDLAGQLGAQPRLTIQTPCRPSGTIVAIPSIIRLISAFASETRLQALCPATTILPSGSVALQGCVAVAWPQCWILQRVGQCAHLSGSLCQPTGRVVGRGRRI